MFKNGNQRKQGYYLLLIIVVLSYSVLKDSLPNQQAKHSVLLDQAQKDISTIAFEPHMMGSDAHKRVQQYIVNEFKSLGLQVTVEKASMLFNNKNEKSENVVAAHIENIIVKLAGKEDTPALALMAHYDSVNSSHGAADDAAGVAALLAAAREAVKSKQPKRDVYFIITDGEEYGLLGAQHFFRHNKLKDKLGLVINFEARGNSGPSMLFETSNNNHLLLEQATQATALKGSSLSYSIYKNMNNNTDLTLVKEAGIRGLNFAFADNLFAYHSYGDNPESLSSQSLMEHVNYAISLSSYFSNSPDLPPTSTLTSNATFFNPIPSVFVTYGELAAYGVGFLALLMTFIWFYLSYQKARLSSYISGILINLWLVISISFIIQLLNNGLYREFNLENPHFWKALYQTHITVFAYALILLGLVVKLVTSLLSKTSINPKKNHIKSLFIIVILLAVIASSDSYQIENILFATTLVFIGWFIFRKPKSQYMLDVGIFLIWIFLLITTLIIAPETSFLFAWPLLLVSTIRLIITRSNMLKLSVELSTVVILILPLAYSLFVLVGFKLPFAPAFLLVLSLLLSQKSLYAIGKSLGHKGVIVLILTGFILLLVIEQRNIFDESHKKTSSLFYLQDEVNHKQFFASAVTPVSDWDKKVLGSKALMDSFSRIIPMADYPIKLKEITTNGLTKAKLILLKDEVNQNQRHIKLRITSPMKAEYLNFLFKPINWFDASIDGNIITNLPSKETQQWWRWRYYAIPKQGIVIDLTIDAKQAFALRIVEVKYGDNENSKLPQLPNDTMPLPDDWSHANVILQELKY